MFLPISLFLMLGPALAENQEVTGEWIEGRRYDYRYLTQYEVKKTLRPLKSFPWIEEDCHDDGDRFANWSKTISYDVTYSGSISFDFLGLGFEIGGDRGQSVEFAFERWVHATKGVRARHVLMEEFETWNGITSVEFRYEDGSIVKGSKTYPMKLEKLNYGLIVKREILEVCQ